MASSSENSSFHPTPSHGEDGDEHSPTTKDESETGPKPTSPTPSMLRTHFLKSLSAREPSFSEFTSSPSRFTCSATPLHHTPFHLNKSHSISSSHHSHSHRCISSAFNKDRLILSIAVSGPLVYTGSHFGNIRVWKLPDFPELAQIKSNKAAGAVRALAVSDDRLFAAFSDCKIRVWRRSWDGFPTHVRIATIPTVGNYLRNYISGKDHKNMMKHLGGITALAINGGGDLLYSVSADTSVKIWQISNLKCIDTIRAHTQAVNAIIMAEDGAVLYTASDDATVKVWRCAGGRYSLALTLPTHSSSPVKALALATDGVALYAGCSDGYLHCWLSAHMHMQYGGPLQGHRHAVLCLACVSNYVASGSADLTCRVWLRERDGHTCLAVLEGHVGPVRCVAAFAASRAHHGSILVCTASLGGTLKVWRVASSGHVSLGPIPSPSPSPTRGGLPTFSF